MLMPTEGILDESLCYLIGGIDNAPDQGKGWRKIFTEDCKKRGLKIKFLDPTDKITGLQEEVDQEHERITTLKKEAKWTELSLLMEKIVREDHRSIDLSDFVVVYLDTSIHTCGTYFELQSAFTEKKPYFIVVKGGKTKTPVWLFGICDHRNIYDNTEDVVDRLCQLNTGTIPLSDRWVLFRKQIRDL